MGSVKDKHTGHHHKVKQVWFIAKLQRNAESQHYKHCVSKSNMSSTVISSCNPTQANNTSIGSGKTKIQSVSHTERNSITTMVKQFAQWTSAICSSSLFAVHGIKTLVNKQSYSCYEIRPSRGLKTANRTSNNQWPFLDLLTDLDKFQ